MGLILDLAVVALALAVVGSLALLAWTLAVSAVRATKAGRARVAASRESLVAADSRLRSAADRTSTTLAQLTNRTSRGDPSDR